VDFLGALDRFWFGVMFLFCFRLRFCFGFDGFRSGGFCLRRSLKGDGDGIGIFRHEMGRACFIAIAEIEKDQPDTN